MKFIFSYLKKYQKLISVVILLKITGTIVELFIPYILEYLIDDIVPTQDITKAVLWGLIMIAVAFLARVLNVSANRRSAKVAGNATYDMRRDLFYHSIHLSGNQMDTYGLPSITSRMTSDSYNIQNFIRSLFAMGIRAPIIFIGGIIITLTMDVGMAFVLCIIAPILIVLIVIISQKGIPLFDQVQVYLDQVVRIMRENITGIHVVKALSKEEYEINRFKKGNDDLTSQEIKANIMMALPGPMMNLFLNIGLSLVVLVGAYRVNGGYTKPGVILAFLTYFNMILMGVMGLNRIFMMMSKANASANRIELVIKAEDELKPVPVTENSIIQTDTHIKFSHVYFQYGKDSSTEQQFSFHGEKRQNTLTDINFEMKKGSSLGIIGATGCGKTTIINLLMRFYDTTDGTIYINGKDIKCYPLPELRKMFGAVFQNDVIFADTIAENISFGRDIIDDRIQEASRDALGAEFIEAYEDGYYHRANMLGSNFSGGQKQRILIARALADKPEILVLDDSSSALDYKTDAQLRKAIHENYSDSTTIIIAQRISSIMNLDQIIMLEEGEIIGHGTHEQLLQTCQKYRDIYEAQMGEGD